MTSVRDTTLVFRRYILQTLRNPVWMFFGIVQPIMYLVLFAPLLVKVASSTPGFPKGGAYNVFIPGLLVQDCAGVPPQSDSINPMGTCKAWNRSRPKKYSTAEKPPALCGLHTSHAPTTSSAG